MSICKAEIKKKWNSCLIKLCFKALNTLKKAKYKNQNGLKFKQSSSMLIPFLFDIVT